MGSPNLWSRPALWTCCSGKKHADNSTFSGADVIEDDFGLEHIDIVATHRRLMKTIIYTRDCAEEDRLRTDRIYRSLYPRQDGVPSEDHAEDEVSKSFDAHGWNYILQIKETTRRSYSYRSIHPLHLLLLGALAFLQRQRPSGRETAETAETAETLQHRCAGAVPRYRARCTWVAPRGSFGPCCAAVWEARCGRGELLVERRRAGLFEPSKSTYRSARRTRCRTSSRHEETLKTCNMI